MKNYVLIAVAVLSNCSGQVPMIEMGTETVGQDPPGCTVKIPTI